MTTALAAANRKIELNLLRTLARQYSVPENDLFILAHRYEIGEIHNILRQG